MYKVRNTELNMKELAEWRMGGRGGGGGVGESVMGIVMGGGQKKRLGLEKLMCVSLSKG